MAIEDFTTYTEEDPETKINVTSSKISLNFMTNDATAWVVYDKTATHFGTTFEHYVENHNSNMSNAGQVGTWMVSNAIEDSKVAWDGNHEGVFVRIQDKQNSMEIAILECEDNGLDWDDTSFNIGQSIWLTIERTGDTTLEVRIYDSAERGGGDLVNTLNVAIPSGRSYRYIYGMVSWDKNGAQQMVLDIENLDLNEEEEPEEHGIIAGGPTPRLIGSGTMDSDQFENYIDFEDNLVPNLVPAQSFSAPYQYYITWTSGDENGNSFNITFADDENSWENLDYFELEGYAPGDAEPLDTFDVYENGAWDNLILSDQVYISVPTLSISETDTLTLTDTIFIDALQTLGISETDTLTLTDTPYIDALQTVGISEVEALTISDTISLSKITNISKSDTLNLTDTPYIDALQTLSISETDTLVLSDSISKTFLLHKSVTNTLTLTDSVSISKIGENEVFESDTLTLTDTHFIDALQTLGISEKDVITLTDTLSTTFLLHKSLSDSLSLADTSSISKITAFSESDSLSLTDKVSITTTRIISKTDTITLTDTSYIDALQTLRISKTDTLTLTDTISISKVGEKNISITESLTLTDTLSKILIINLSKSDSLSLTDTVSIYKPTTYGKSLSESLTLTDTATIIKPAIKGKIIMFNPFTGTFQFLKDLTEIDSHLTPDTTNTYDIGSDSLKFRTGYIGSMYIGSSTNYTHVSDTGDLTFVGSAGLTYGEIYTVGATDTITISGTGQANKIQITSFSVNGASNNMTPAHGQDHITITKAGHYMCNVSLHVESAGAGGSDTFGFSVYKNNGYTEFPNCHAHRKLAGGGGDVGSINLSGIIDLTVNDTIEVWCWNEDSTDNLIVEDVTLSLIQIGG